MIIEYESMLSKAEMEAQYFPKYIIKCEISESELL
jgi:hypothetical protein